MVRIFSWENHLRRLKDKDEGQRQAAYHFLNPSDCCFFCGEPLGDDLVMWHGDGQIWLHPGCAVALGEHLIKDGLITREGYGVLG